MGILDWIKIFLVIKPKEQTRKKVIDKLGFKILKNFNASKNTIKKVKYQWTG